MKKDSLPQQEIRFVEQITTLLQTELFPHIKAVGEVLHTVNQPQFLDEEAYNHEFVVKTSSLKFTFDFINRLDRKLNLCFIYVSGAKYISCANGLSKLFDFNLAGNNRSQVELTRTHLPILINWEKSGLSKIRIPNADHTMGVNPPHSWNLDFTPAWQFYNSSSEFISNVAKFKNVAEIKVPLNSLDENAYKQEHFASKTPPPNINARYKIVKNNGTEIIIEQIQSSDKIRYLIKIDRSNTKVIGILRRFLKNKENLVAEIELNSDPKQIIKMQHLLFSEAQKLFK